MEFVIFERADSALLVVPAMFKAPLGCGDLQQLRPLGRCDVELEDFSPDVVASLGLHGFAQIQGDDLARIRPLLQRIGIAAS